MLNYYEKHKLFVWRGPYEDRQIPQDAGFEWNKKGKAWVTTSPYVAYKLRGEADSLAQAQLAPVGMNIYSSMQADDMLAIYAPPCPPGLAYLPYQEAGISHMVDQLLRGRRAVACMDEQGLGKTIQAIGTANALGFKKLLVICPASLRLNWVTEIERWHCGGLPVSPILDGNKKIDNEHSLVVSYELCQRVKDFTPDLVIVDEIHYLKTPTAKRTKKVLGFRKSKGLINKAPAILLSGTPIPNGKPTEIHSVLKQTAPDVIAEMVGYNAYLRRFCEFYWDGLELHITGIKRSEEFYNRLRGSGYMLRRLKKDVLKDLPPKQYKMVVMPPSGQAKKVMTQEARFSAEEILASATPNAAVSPELRRAMGIAKVPQCVEYIRNLLDSGVQKVGVFGHHRDVMFELRDKLEAYHPVIFIGGMSDKNKNQAVTDFQGREDVRVFLGNSAAAEGITLTAAHHVVDVEPDWVPGINEQRYDRFHRISQTKSVMVHILVIDGSLDARILSSAAHKGVRTQQLIDR